MFDGEVLVLECQYRATSCIEVCDMVASRMRNGREWGSELDVASFKIIRKLAYTKTKIEPTLLLQVK
jgi:hypothetical protein